MIGMRLVKFYDDIMYDVDPTDKSEQEIAAEQAIWIPEAQHTIKRNNDSWIWNGTEFEEPTEEYLAEKERRNQKRQANYELETKRHYLALGQFLVKFEHLIESVQQLAERILMFNGLNLQLAQMFTVELTANELAEQLVKIVHRTTVLSVNPETKDLTLQIIDLLKKVIEERNEIIHGKLYVGFSSEDEESFKAFSGYRHKVKREENKFLNISYTVDDINRLIIRCNVLQDCFFNLLIMITQINTPAMNDFLPSSPEGVRKAIVISLTQQGFWKQPNDQRENDVKSLLPKLQKFIDAYSGEGKMFRQEWKPFTI